MEVKKESWPITSAHGMKEDIDTNPDFQRPAVWTKAQKQLLIDTILRGYDVPKFYWRQTSKSPEKFEVVDGQQRLRAIWEYRDGEYPLAKHADPIDGDEIGGLYYQNLPSRLKRRFDVYNLDVIIVSDTDDDEVRVMFLRLQNGTSLKAQEKRNAMPGQMREFVKATAEHPFFSNCAFANSRFTFDLVAAQMVLIELSGGPCNIKNGNLNKMYEDHREFDPTGAKAKKVKRVLDYLSRAFPGKTPELERYSAVSLYALVSYLLETFSIQGREAEISKWFIDFETHRRGQDHLSEDETMVDPFLLTYREKTSHSTDALDSLQWRHESLLDRLFESVPDILPKDPKRAFTREQRMAIFRRDGMTCQVKLKCDGVKCEWDNWHADHIVPHSKGGQTTVENGRVACPNCNTALGNSCS
jgi:hypothetical protein